MSPTGSRVPGSVRPGGPTLLVALLAGGAGVAGSYAVAGFTPDFVAGQVAGFTARAMPSAVVSFAIVVLGDLGHQINLVAALALSAFALGVVALAGLVLAARMETPLLAPVATTVGCALLAFAVTRAPLASGVAGLAAAFVTAVWSLWPSGDGTTVSTARRRLLGSATSALVAGIAGFALGSRGDPHGETVDADVGIGEGPAVQMPVSSLLAEARRKSLDVDGLEPLVSTDFYEVDINATNPALDADEWSLRVTGAVEQEISYDYDELRELEPENMFHTLRCVGESLNGNKLDNAVWTGVPVTRLVEPAGVSPECCVMLRAADGYFEQFPREVFENALLAYGMNGEALPRQHGFPARAVVPGHWGEISVKWITEIEVIDRPVEGYWERRGWEGTGPVNTVAKLYVDNRLDDGRVEVAGHAYAGVRGIEQVEVSTDGGETWDRATLSDPLPGEAVWRQWVYRYEPPADAHEVVVRATDGTGTLQPRDRANAFPSGATGWVSTELEP